MLQRLCIKSFKLCATTRHRTSHWSALSTSNKRRCREFDTRTIIQTSVEKILVTFKRSNAKVSKVQEECFFIRNITKRIIEWKTNSRQIDTLVPSVPHLLQGIQSRQASKHSIQMLKTLKGFQNLNIITKYGFPCYALYFGPRKGLDSRWVPAVITKVHGTRKCQDTASLSSKTNLEKTH